MIKIFLILSVVILGLICFNQTKAQSIKDSIKSSVTLHASPALMVNSPPENYFYDYDRWRNCHSSFSRRMWSTSFYNFLRFGDYAYCYGGFGGYGYSYRGFGGHGFRHRGFGHHGNRGGFFRREIR